MNVNTTALIEVAVFVKLQQAIAVIEGNGNTLITVHQIGDNSDSKEFTVLTVNNGSVKHSTFEGSSVEVGEGLDSLSQ